ncbi:hypothetical protein ACHAXA_002600 [Cyclostephanos tholiformis]|uniref:Uncharacterized protein n=1 Tax=Cyclostephanos tholiformis TaxID=382380 RepID=A0ABD3SBM9_9STRA
MILSYQRLLLYAADAYKLSSILLRRVFLQRPTTALCAYGERTRRILLEQSRVSPPSSSSHAHTSRPNVAAIKLLQWDRELNLVRYHGAWEYARGRWWSKSSDLLPWRRRLRSGSSSPVARDLENGREEEATGKESDGKVARVAFLITSEQRRRLSETLGYTPEDIRTLKPIEAMMLLEHGVRRDDGGGDGSSGGGDYRTRLRALMEKNERPAQVERGEAVEVATAIECNPLEYNDNSTIDIKHKYSAEAQRINAKPDVVMALRSVEEKNAMRGSVEVADVCIMKEEEEEKEEELRVHELGAVVDSTEDKREKTRWSRPTMVDAMSSSPESKVGGCISIETEDGSPDKGMSSPMTTAEGVLSLAPPSRPPAYVDFASDSAELLRMKPDVAATILASSSRHLPDEKLYEEERAEYDKEEGGDESGICWYEVIDVVGGGGIVALFQTKQEALECVRIKSAILRGRSGGETGPDDVYLVRRRDS